MDMKYFECASWQPKTYYSLGIWGLKGQLVEQLYFKITMQKLIKTTLIAKQKKMIYASILEKKTQFTSSFFINILLIVSFCPSIQSFRQYESGFGLGVNNKNDTTYVIVF
jgi:hypothetical protein